MKEKEQFLFNSTLNHICRTLDSAINSDEITDMRLRQKLFALSSFVEFLSAGADVETNGIKDNIATYNIKLK